MRQHPPILFKLLCYIVKSFIWARAAAKMRSGWLDRQNYAIPQQQKSRPGVTPDGFLIQLPARIAGSAAFPKRVQRLG
jgi:hypothetical protein